MNDAYGITEQDQQTLKAYVERLAKDPYRETWEEELGANQSPDVYVAVPPCGQGIPARSGNIPGVQNCCIFKLVLQEGTTDGVSGFLYQLVPVLIIGTGDNETRTVYNIYDVAVPPLMPPNEKYIRIKKDKLGRWLVTLSGSVSSPTTTTSTRLIPQPCKGNCKWIWNGTCWTTDGCTTSTTTSTTTTASGTTTTAACLCPPGPTTTSTTTTCSGCVYPPLCGTAIGQCYHASCTKQQLPQVSSCSCSTTTTPFCNCATTSTNGPCLTPPCGGQGDNCGANCVWKWNGTQWVLGYQNCATCPTPPANTNICGTYITYCGPGSFVIQDISFRHAVGGGCFEKCCWCWSPITNQWKLLDGGFGGTPDNPTCCVFLSELGPIVCHPASGTDGPFCTGGLICTPPSYTPNVGSPSNCGLDDCNTAMLELDPLIYSDVNPNAPKICDCSDHSLGSTTTPSGPTTSTTPGGPCNCGFCYTSTTTTTLPPVSGNCLWQCSGGGLTWSLIANHCACSQSCICNTPAQVCVESCQIQLTNCISNTTTT